MARTRYQHGEIVVKHGKAHDSYMGRWKEDVRLSNGQIIRRKRSRVFGIVGRITEKQAKRQLDGVLVRVNDPGYLPESVTTFQALAQEWGDQAFREMKPSTVLNMRGHLANHLLPFFGKRQVREITTRDIDTFLSNLAVSRKTKKNIFSTLKLILKQGRAWGNVRENIWESAKKIGKSETEVRAYSDAEVEDILSRSTGAVRLFYWLAVETGMRAGELCGLRVATLTQSENCFACVKPFGAARFSLRRRKTQFGKSPSHFRLWMNSEPTLETGLKDSSSPRRTVRRGMLTLC
jgi:hypothetical protein